MDSIPCSKRGKEMGAIDRISALPDALISHILSSLPTLDAVRTTVLSTRWNNQWTSVQNLDFDEGNRYFSSTHSSDRDWFTRFVNRVLVSRDSSDIHKFTALFDRAHYRHNPSIVDWICTAVRHNVVALRLKYKEGTSIQMPPTVFTCKTLRFLTLHFSGRYITFDPPTSGCFPSLESLKLTVQDPVEHEMEKLFSSCPKLVYLSLRIVAVIAAFNFKVSAPELKQLKIISSCPGPQFYVDAPKLENLDLFCSFPQPNLFLENAKSLVTAAVVLKENYELFLIRHAFPNSLNMLLAQISEVKYLSLSAPIPVDCCFPAFGNLTKLELVLDLYNYWKLLTVVLQKVPNLEYLSLEEKGIGDHEWSFNLPEVVPSCLSSHLKSIYMRKFKGRRSEMKMAEYLLKNGYHLNRFTICYTGVLDKKEELRKELFMFRRAITCSILFLMSEDFLQGQKAYVDGFKTTLFD